MVVGISVCALASVGAAEGIIIVGSSEVPLPETGASDGASESVFGDGASVGR